MGIIENYQEALDFLYIFVDHSLTRALRYSPELFNLSRMEALLVSLGNPQLRYPVMHVAGTKGKGSVTALCASALTAQGYKTGFYTSPHMQDFRERIQVDGEMISKVDLVNLVNEIKPHIERIPQITTFELTTAIAFLYFARLPVDIAVIEVGLGGRLDATNLVQPLVSVITSLSYDHMALLGNTLAEIAGEKAGIIKQGKPVVVSAQKEEAMQVIEKIALERHCILYQVGKDMIFAPQFHNLSRQSFWVWPSEQEKKRLYLEIPLLGMHQVENAVLAYTALQVANQNGVKISPEAIKTGFANVHWPGRFEILSERPSLVIDSAHNRDSALRLRQAIDDYFPGRPVMMIFGASEDKDISGMFTELLPRVDQLVLTQSQHPRAASTEKLAELARDYNKPTTLFIEIEKALEFAMHAMGEDGVVVATGSLFIAAAVRDVWPEVKMLLVRNS